MSNNPKEKNKTIPDNTYIRISLKHNLLFLLYFFCTNLSVKSIDEKLGFESDVIFLMKGRCGLYLTKI